MPAPTFKARSLTELVDIRARKLVLGRQVGVILMITPCVHVAFAGDQPDDYAVHTGAAEFGENLQTLTYAQIARSVDRLCHHYDHLRPAPLSSGILAERVIAVLTSTAIDESLLEIALAKLGLTALLLSVNNSAAAVAHLVKQTEATHLIFGPKFEAIAHEVQQTLKQSKAYPVEIIPECRFPLWGKGGIEETHVEPYPAVLTPEQENGRTCVILHSSGSTGFPKPVYITHYGLIANCASSLPKTGFSALPLFHGFGHFSIFRCYYHGKTFTLFPPHIPLTSSNIVRIIASSPTKPEQHFAVPYVLKLLAETEEGTRCLAGFEAVSFAGAAVPDDLGDRLVGAGVNLFSVYGTTETGALLDSRRDYPNDKGWNWLRAEGPITEYLRMEPQGSSTFELVVADGWPAKIMSNRPDNSYATKDLFLQHPEHSNWFKYIGRLDDTLTQTLGEKTNPVPIELAIRGNSPLIQECIVFGDGRPQTGALILPSEQAPDLAQDKQAYLDTIWSVIEEANSKAPSHSRLIREMIEILPIGTDIPVATKLSILRPACYKKFASLIDDVYRRYETGSGITKRRITSVDEMETFIHQAIVEAWGKDAHDLEPTTDLFAFGIDSLQATRVRNAIVKTLDLGLEDNSKALGQNIVYEHPSVRLLAQYVLHFGGGQAKEADVAGRQMVEMVETFSREVIHRKADQAEPQGEVILLTGATGSLGAHLLSQLVELPLVSKVICLSRASSHAESLERVRSSLRQRKLGSPNFPFDKVVSLAADINAEHFRLAQNEYDDLFSEVTGVICNHWPVNFNLSLASFQPHIKGAINLLNLTQAAAHDARFYFSSSVGTSQNGPPGVAVKETFSIDPVTAGGMGYGQSKWVVEKIMEQVARDNHAKVGVMRIGQLVGDSKNGVWNTTEAWPLTIKSGQRIGSMPRLKEQLSWLPVDLAAKAIVEIATRPISDRTDCAVYHILNPQSNATFERVVLSGLEHAGIQFKTVSRHEWLNELDKSEDDLSKNPGKKLLSFYKGRIGKEQEREFVDFETGETSKVASTIRECKAVDESLVKLWVKQWRADGFLD